MLKPEDSEKVKDYLRIGNQLRKEGKLDQAIGQYEQALQLNPDFVPALSQLAGIYESQKQFGKALPYREKAAGLRPRNALLKAQLAKTMVRLGKTQEGITLYQKAIALDEQLPPWTYRELGNTLAEKRNALAKKNDQLEEEIAAYQQALKLKPELLNLITKIENNCSRLFHLEGATVMPISIRKKSGRKKSGNSGWIGGIDYPSDMPQIFRQRTRRLIGGEIVYKDKFKIGNQLDNSEQINSSLSKFYSGTFIYAGPFYEHFGHALTESIHRLWAFNNSIHDGIIFAVANKRMPAGTYTPPNWFTQILELLDIPLPKCVFVTKKSVFEHCLIPEPGSELTFGPKEWYRSRLERLQQKILDLTQTLRKDESDLKLFLGRSHILTDKWGVAGEKYFEKLLLDEGYISLIPEKYSICEQLSYLLNAKKIVFTEGSSIYLLELLNYLETDILCIPRRENHERAAFTPHLKNKSPHYTVAQKKGNIATLIHYRKDLVKGNSISIIKDPFYVVETFRNNGFAVLQDWDKNEFLSQEKLDVIAYLEKGISVLKNGNRENILKIEQQYKRLRNITDSLIL